MIRPDFSNYVHKLLKVVFCTYTCAFIRNFWSRVWVVNRLLIRQDTTQRLEIQATPLSAQRPAWTAFGLHTLLLFLK